ncbi:Tol-Pal system beta propeller repeat protein TolB [Palleronia caenipelagi]|uniref:Tol-Pal system protein TolB n=1 Tax=Palleronia caenipelagi TaxID=2489174 RepID=A0A547Q5J9_9RHOB|nr:Tol-Pal system beta propeller repeat protein TolB [Palleronia caenipelagi]TRD21664.1 Tol-Pal system protein TolB [Palleronia caenipelagi]
MSVKALCLIWSAAVLALSGSISAPAVAQSAGEPLRLEITQGVVEPVPFALPVFIDQGGAGAWTSQISDLIAEDLVGTGLFRRIGSEAFIAPVTEFSPSVTYANWKAINAQALITGAVSADGAGGLTVQFRLFDVFSEAPLGQGLQLQGTEAGWRRLAHKVADAIYGRITGESGYFDSRVVFVSEQGPKNARQKRLAVMDYDGANVQYLTDASSLVLAPRFSQDGNRVLYTSYESGFPQIYQMTVGATNKVPLPVPADGMSFAPRYAPDGNTVVFSAAINGNTDLYRLRPGGQAERLTSAPSIETAPSYSPDGSQIVFESDRSGTPQLYVMPASGGEAQRISFGAGRYGTPVWSPRGDLIAFTKQNDGRFHIGVMRTDGSNERLLTASFLDEGPTWAPNGRVLMFTRESAGANGQPALYSVDVSGRNLRKVPTPSAASDPAWSPLLP